MAEFPQIDSGLAVPVFKKGDDPIDAINKMMLFLSNVITSRFPSTNNQLRNSSNPRQQATIHDGRCLKPKRKRDATWFREKVLLVKAQGNAYQADDLDVYDSDRDEISTAKAVLMANFVHEMPYSEPSHFVEHPENEIHSDSNIILYSQYLIESQNTVVQDTNSSAQQDALILSVFQQLSNQVTNCNKVNNENLIPNESLSAELERYKERVKLLEERQNVDLGTREKLIINYIIRDKDAQFVDFEKEINSLKQTLSEQLKEKESLTKTFNIFKNESKEKEARNIDKEIALEKKVKELDNIETNVISIADSEETLMLEEESRSKMLLKQSDPIVLEKNVKIKPIINAKLNRLYEDFGKYFVPQQELSDDQAFRYHLGQFDNVVKKWITPDALTDGEWGFEHTKAVFLKEIIPFVKTLKDISDVFDKDLLNEVTEVQTVFNQMEAAIQQYHVDNHCFEIQKEQFLIEND
ncbi:hypothetical protein Tco_1146356 [Tanacetum coccineum]